MKKVFSILSLFLWLAAGQITVQAEADAQAKKSPESSFQFVEKVKPIPEKLKKGFESINGQDAINHLIFLSSDSLEGRDTGKRGHQIAAEYVATMFSLWGLKPAGDMPEKPDMRRLFFRQSPLPKKPPSRSYLQQIEMKEIVASEGSAKVEWKQGNQYQAKMFEQNIDYRFKSNRSQIISAPVVFVGYGISEKTIKFNEYKDVNVRGKIVMMLSEIPRKDDPDSPFAKEKIKAKYIPPRMRRPSFLGNHKTRLALNNGAVAIIMVENSPKTNPDIAKKVLKEQLIDDERPIIPGKNRKILLTDSQPKNRFPTLPTINVSRQMADEILKFSGHRVESLKQKIEKTLKPNSLELKGVSFTIKNKIKTRLFKSPNVLGYIEGSHPELKKEVVVLGAHLDHLGKRGDYIYNGADDNGSGSVSVMEVAQAISLNPIKPKRTILFALWTGEEKGLLGSRYYVSHPFFPLNKTTATLNLDMVSREWDKKRLKMISRFMGINISEDDMKKIDVSRFCSLYYGASSPFMRQIIQQNNQYVGLTVFLRESKGVYTGGGGSDHMAFAMKKIPWAYFAGALTKDFHQPSDSLGKVSKKLMKLITRLTYLTAFELANR